MDNVYLVVQIKFMMKYQRYVSVDQEHLKLMKVHA